MTDDEIIELWAQANKLAGIKHPHTFDELKEFAQLISDKVKEQTMSSANRQWVKMSQNLIAAEREACAKVCEKLDLEGIELGGEPSPAYGNDCAAAIRSRSNT